MPFPPPEFVQLYPTIRCNQRCHFCFNRDAFKALSWGGSDLSYARASRLLDILQACGVREIDVMGGEPLMLPWIPDFVSASHEKHIAVNISTNGGDTQAISALKHLEKGYYRIGISLEGSNAARHNAITRSSHFDTAVGNIRRLVSWGLDPIVKTVLTRHSAHDLQRIADLLRGLGVHEYFVIHMDLMSKDRRQKRDAVAFPDFEIRYRRLKEANTDMDIFKVNASCFSKNSLPDGVRCAGGVRKLSILPDGSVFPCNLFHGLQEFRLGNVFEDDFAVMWSNPILEPFRKCRGNACTRQDCSHRDSCTGGCPAHVYYHYGKMEGMDIRCGLSYPQS